MFRYNQVRKEKQFMKINNITKIYHNKYNIILSYHKLFQ